MKPLIGITTEEAKSILSWGPNTYRQNHQYSDAILDAGGIPVFMPFTHTTQELRAMYDRMDGILFAGGNDIDPAEYGESKHVKTIDISPERDRIEIQLVKWAIADNKPILAICRGLQVLNVALGGTLIQDIPTEVLGASNHDESTDQKDKHYISHQLRLDPDSKLATIFGRDSVPANTHHHQAIKKPAPGLSVTGWAEDNIIEAAEIASSRFAIGVQCHPESLYTLNAEWSKLFKAFVDESTQTNHEILDAARKSSSIDEPVVLEAL